MRNLKRLLSAALAMVMSMSIASVASAATAAEFSDAGDINYTEAVEVMSTLGVLEGFETGDFQPEGTLTREQAAKIIAYMLLGTENAEKLGSNVSSFTDVAADRWSAGYINYCATNGIIAGNGDGTFAPEGKLTGYAFAKMLLGALGYKADVEGFTGYQWTLKVASIAAKAGLLNDIQNFSGNAEITREQASQMALNCLKATLVEYTGNTIDVTTGDSTVTIGNTKYEYVVSNNKEINQNIDATVQGNNANYFTLQFGEQYFPSLVLKSAKEHGITDDFQRPSNQWIYNKQNIGIYPVTPDFIYTSQMARKDEGETAKLKALGLKGYDVARNNSSPYLSKVSVYVNGKALTTLKDADNNELLVNDGSGNWRLDNVADIANLTDNGATVLVYNIDKTAGNTITNVVVMRDQLMTVKKVGTDYVSFEKFDMDGNVLNHAYIDTKVAEVKDGDAAYEVVSALKEGDAVVVTPLYTGTTGGNDNYSVAEAYVPTTVTGKLTRVDTYRSNNGAYNWKYAVVVGGETYKVAQWNLNFASLDADTILATLKDVTLVLDKDGNALQIKDVGATSNYVVVKDTYQSLVDGKLVNFIQGWDISGTELNLNIGSQNAVDGDLYYYTNENAPGNAEYRIDGTNNSAKNSDGAWIEGVYTVNTGKDISASNSKIDLVNNGSTWIKTGIKFIYVNFDASGDVDSIQVLNGVQNVTAADLAQSNGGATAQAAVDRKNQEVRAVVIKTESNEAISTKLLYVVDKFGSEGVVDGKRVYGYTVAMNSEEGLETKSIFSHDNISVGKFASYALREVEGYDNFYDLKNHDQATKSTSTANAKLVSVANVDRGLIVMDNIYGMDGTDDLYNAELNVGGLGLDAAYVLRVLNAEWVDLTGKDIDSTKDLATELAELSKVGKTFNLSFVFNDNVNTDGFRNVDMIVITDDTQSAPAYTTQSQVNAWLKAGDPVTANPSFASGVYIPVGEKLDITGNVTLNGSFTVNGTLDITGNLNLNGATLNGIGKVFVNGTLVLGSTITEGVYVQATTAQIAKNVTVGGALVVTGSVTATGSAKIVTTSTAAVVVPSGSGSCVDSTAGGTVVSDGSINLPATLKSVTAGNKVYSIAADTAATTVGVKAGEVTLTITPAAGVAIDTVKVGQNVVAVVDNSVTFTKGETDVTVTVKTKSGRDGVTMTSKTYTIKVTDIKGTAVTE